MWNGGPLDGLVPFRLEVEKHLVIGDDVNRTGTL
jgi:hypothetical protein